MRKKIETERTYWIGMTETQRDDLVKLTGILQLGDLAKFYERMDFEPSEIASIQDTLADLKEVLKHGD